MPERKRFFSVDLFPNSADFFQNARRILQIAVILKFFPNICSLSVVPPHKWPRITDFTKFPSLVILIRKHLKALFNWAVLKVFEKRDRRSMSARAMSQNWWQCQHAHLTKEWTPNLSPLVIIVAQQEFFQKRKILETNSKSWFWVKQT